MKLLALDTSTERLLVGVRSLQETDRWLNVDAQGSHATLLVQAIETLLKGDRPDAIGVALGPGSFTGLRVGLATAKGLAAGWGVPLFGLDNLHAMARQMGVLRPGGLEAFLPVIDARKKKFYGGLWQGTRCLIPSADWAPLAWLERALKVWSGPVVVSGYQGNLLAEALGSSWPPHWQVQVQHDWMPALLEELEQQCQGGNGLPDHVGPRYLRLSEAEENQLNRKDP